MIELIFVIFLLITSVALIVLGMSIVNDYENDLAELESSKESKFNIGIFREISD